MRGGLIPKRDNDVTATLIDLAALGTLGGFVDCFLFHTKHFFFPRLFPGFPSPIKFRDCFNQFLVKWGRQQPFIAENP